MRKIFFILERWKLCPHCGCMNIGDIFGEDDD